MQDPATTEWLIALHGQVNEIETQLREIKHAKLHARVADPEQIHTVRPAIGCLPLAANVALRFSLGAQSPIV